jgi:hypothetical protein
MLRAGRGAGRWRCAAVHSQISPSLATLPPSCRAAGRLLFELGGIPERELEKLKEEAARLGKSSFAFAFYMDTQKEERARGVTIACTTKEFYTDKYHYTIIDAPGAYRGGGVGGMHCAPLVARRAHHRRRRCALTPPQRRPS